MKDIQLNIDQVVDLKRLSVEACVAIVQSLVVEQRELLCLLVDSPEVLNGFDRLMEHIHEFIVGVVTRFLLTVYNFESSV